MPGDSLQGDEYPEGTCRGLGWWKQATHPCQSKPEMMGVGGEDADKQMGIKRVGEACLRDRESYWTWGEGETRSWSKLGILGGWEKEQVCLGEC